VVTTHGHWDHRGGNSSFDVIAAHEAATNALLQPVPRDELVAHISWFEAMREQFKVYREIDTQYFRLLVSDYEPRPLPHGFSLEQWKIQPRSPDVLLTDGETIDLGGRYLE